MKIVQTFWSGGTDSTKALDIKSGWSSGEYHWMSWALSCLTLRKFYDQVELFTDELGKKILIDLFGFPYTDVHIIFDSSFSIRPELFSLAKMRTYAYQEDPFIHVDGDVYIWNAFPSHFENSDLIASNLEVNLFFNKEILEAVHQNSFSIPSHLEGVHQNDQIFASNAGILGGKNLDFIKDYCNSAIDFIAHNKEKLEKVNVGNLNWLIEQISFFYLASKRNIPISYLVKDAVRNPLYEGLWRFSDIPNVQIIHPVGGCKRERYVLGHLSRRLRLEYPSFYYKIRHQCKKKNLIPKNKIYHFTEIGSDAYTYENYPTFSKNVQRDTRELFTKAFSRTISIANNHSDKPISDITGLNAFIAKSENLSGSEALKEIFELEKIKYNMLSRLVNRDSKEKLYNENVHRYRKASNFFMNETWMETRIKIADRVVLFNQAHDWHTILDKSLSVQPLEPNIKYLVSLHIDIMDLDIVEIHHEGFDEVLLSSTTQVKIKSLANTLLDFFDGDISLEDWQYQKLLFETIKRMAFDNILEIL